MFGAVNLVSMVKQQEGDKEVHRDWETAKSFLGCNKQYSCFSFCGEVSLFLPLLRLVTHLPLFLLAVLVLPEDAYALLQIL